MKSTTWVVVADSSRARLFSAASASGVLVEVEDLIHSASRLHETDLNSDRPGRSFDSAGEGRHAMESPQNQEAILFAREISAHLKEHHDKGEFSKLALIAAPEFLGHLRATIDQNLMKMVALEVDKNLVQHDLAEIRKSLPQHLPI